MVRKTLFNTGGLWQQGAVILRIVAGLIIFKYGLEFFSPDKMKGYTDWLIDLKFPQPEVTGKLGKLIELTGGLLMILGLFTRLAAISLIITLSVIVFVMGEPEFLAADGAFLLLMIFIHYLLAGPGKFSLDHVLFRSKNNQVR